MLKTYIATYAIDIVALLYLYGLLNRSSVVNSYRKKPFICGIVLTIIVILSEAGTIPASDGGTKLRSLNVLCNVFGFALTPIIPIVLIAISDIKIFHVHKILLLPTLINIVATVLSPLFGFVFYVNVNNQYERGTYFPIFVVIYIINLSLLLINTLRTGKKYHYPIKGKLFALSLFVVAGTSIQLINPSVFSSWHCVTLSLLLYFLLLSEFDSSFDKLTGLYNRATFEKVTKQMTSRKAFSVIVLDINNFKNINDTYGHNYGDTVIKAVAAIVRSSLANHYACYRIGGDEFLIICNETSQEKIEFQLRSMTNALAEERENDSRLPTIAYGYSIFQGGETPDFKKVLKEADDRMYFYKKLHKAGELKAVDISQQDDDFIGIFDSTK